MSRTRAVGGVLLSLWLGLLLVAVLAGWIVAVGMSLLVVWMVALWLLWLTSFGAVRPASERWARLHADVITPLIISAAVVLSILWLRGVIPPLFNGYTPLHHG